ncbi:MAG: ABC transporter permease, partial [Spirochaetota bacterium]
NIGLEGMMLFGAFAAAVAAYYTGNPFIGMAAGMIAGGLLALIHGVISITFRGDQIVSGVAINLFAGGFTVFMLRVLFNQSGNSPVVTKMPVVPLSFSVNDTTVSFDFSVIVYIIYILVILSHFFIYRTKAGLRMRAVGEHPLAADTVGINVYRVRYFGTVMSGVLAGLAGSYLSIGALSQFTKGMSSGRGFIALAAMIFGKWTPLGALGASLLFGFFDALQIVGQQNLKFLPTQFIQMWPYLLTLLALAGVVGRAVAPSADGVPYNKQNE